MRTQLAEHYLDRDERRCGVYLALYFGPEHWTADGDDRRRRCVARDADELGIELREQARQLTSPNGLQVASHVLDCSVRAARQAIGSRRRAFALGRRYLAVAWRRSPTTPVHGGLCPEVWTSHAPLSTLPRAAVTWTAARLRAMALRSGHVRADHQRVPLRRRAPEPAPDLDRVLLLVDELGPLGARVSAARSGVADLELDDPGISGALDGIVATMVTVGDARLEGRLETGVRPRHVRFLRAADQRRAHVRAPLVRDLVLVPERLDGIWRVRTRDLSVGGALIADGTRLPLGARLQVQLALEVADAPLRTLGRVIRAPSPSLRVVLFELADQSDAALVAQEVELGQ